MAHIKVVYQADKQVTTTAPDDEAEKIVLQMVKETRGAVYAKVEYDGRWQMYNVDAQNRVTMGVNSTLVSETINELERQSR